MEKKVRNVSVKLLPLTIYLDDIQKIEEILKKHSSSYRIETEDYTFDSVDEIVDSKLSHTKELSIVSSTPDVRIYFNDLSARITYQDDDLSACGLAEKIRLVVEGDPSWLRKAVSWHSNVLVFLVVAIVTISLVWETVNLPFLDKGNLAMSIFTATNLLWIAWVFLARHTTIYLVKKNEYKSFFSLVVKHGKKIVVTVLGAVILALIKKYFQ